MRKALTCIIASFLLGVGTLGYAQQQPPARQEAQRPQDEGAPLTLRGCLTKGSQSQQYIVADERSGQKIAFAASSKLDSYVNQTVEISGRVVDRGGDKSFQPESVKSISSSCNATQKQQDKQQ
jgi:hypothetical protein